MSFYPYGFPFANMSVNVAAAPPLASAIIANDDDDEQ